MTDTTETGQHPVATRMYDRVIVPLDGSEASEAALTYAAHIPCRELVLLHVSVDDEFIVPEWFGHSTDDEEPEDQTLHAIMGELADSLKTGTRDVKVDIRVGDVAEEIIAEGKNADLIVMMTHGRGAAGRLIFGSVADRVVRHGETPTLLLRAGDHTADPHAPKRIVIALDGSKIAEQAIAPGVKAAKFLGVPVTLIRAIGVDEIRAALRARGGKKTAPFEQSEGLYEETRKKVTGEAGAYLEERAERLRSEGVEANVQILEGSAAFALKDAITPDDLVVMTTRGQGGYKRWSIGSVAEKLVRESPAPLLVQRSAQPS